MPGLELVIFIGLQASGKTSFYRARLAQTHAHISKDLLRNNRRRERRQQELIRAALSEGRSVVVDNTNPTRDDRAALIAIAREFGARVVGYYFASGVQECLERNRGRSGRELVPEVAIYSTVKRLERPASSEGFDGLYFVRPQAGGGFDVQEWRDEEETDAPG
jgi:predicted kinase